MRTLLSRTAESLYWLGRYSERAGSTARLIEMGNRMAMLPGSHSHEEWRSVAAAAGCLDLFEDPDAISETAIIRTLILDKDNPSSIRACLERARANGRSVRNALTIEMWEVLNDGWRKLELMSAAEVQRDLPVVLEWVKSRTSMFRGAIDSAMLRNDGYYFLRLGGHLERADMMLRLLDVKYFVLLPETDVVGGGRDHHQWTSVLYATSAVRAYHHTYRGDYNPAKIADFLILNDHFPRSLAYSYLQIGRYLASLEERYGVRHACHDTADEMIAHLRRTQVGEVFQVGLHEFVGDAIRRTQRLGTELYQAYHL